MGVWERNYDEQRESRNGSALRLGAWSGRFSVTTWLIIINVAVLILDPFVFNGRLYAYGKFSTLEGFKHLEVWRLVTFQFLHASLMHIAFNMFGLYMFGPIVEQHLGRRKFLAFYLVGGIFGGLMYLLLGLISIGYNAATGGHLPAVLAQFENIATPLVGASAGVFAVIMGCAYIMPKERVVMFPIPFEVPIKVLAYGYVGVALVTLITGGTNAGGEAAHIGGAIAGFFFVRNSHLLRDFFDVMEDSRRVPNPNNVRRVRQMRIAPHLQPKAEPRKQGMFMRLLTGEAAPIDDAEVDRILDKVRREGVHGLTDRDKEILHRSTEEKRRAGGA